MQEVESKYLVKSGCSPGAASRRVCKILRQAGFVVQPQTKEHLKDTYFDTEEGHIRQSGWVCRLRKKSNETAIVALKKCTENDYGLFRRDEISYEMTEPVASNWFMLAGPVTEVLEKYITPTRVLVPLFRQRTGRKIFLISRTDLPDCAIEMAVDTVSIKQLDIRYTEIEFELLQGSELVLHTIASLLLPLQELTIARMSKFDRGMFGVDPSSTCKAHSEAPMSLSWQQLGHQYLTTQLGQIEYYEPFAWEAIHPEGVHQMRVASRRLRAGLQAFANVLPCPETIVVQTAARAITKKLGSVRDLDVHLMDIVGGKTSRSYLQEVQAERNLAHEQLISALEHGAVHNLRCAFDQLLNISGESAQKDLTIEDAIRKQILPALEKLKRRGQHVVPSDTRALHKLRLELKKLNYLFESLPRRHSQLIKAVSQLQDILGKHQDAHVAMQRLARVKETRKNRRMKRRYDKRIAKAHKRFKPAWRQFIKEANRPFDYATF